jgi:hypothetical protein
VRVGKGGATSCCDVVMFLRERACHVGMCVYLRGFKYTYIEGGDGIRERKVLLRYTGGRLVLVLLSDFI